MPWLEFKRWPAVLPYSYPHTGFQAFVVFYLLPLDLIWYQFSCFWGLEPYLESGSAFLHINFLPPVPLPFPLCLKSPGMHGFWTYFYCILSLQWPAAVSHLAWQLARELVPTSQREVASALTFRHPEHTIWPFQLGLGNVSWTRNLGTCGVGG